MANPVPKLSRHWIKQARIDFRRFLEQTNFPDPKREGTRGPEFEYPEWLIMFLALLAVKCKARNYLAIHRMATAYWPVIAEGLKLEPISETQLRGRLKKISHFPGKPAAFIFQMFPEMDEAKARQRR